MNLLEVYVRELRDIRSTGAAVKETSYYTPLANLLNDIGKSLKPKIRCILNPRNEGAGIPDGGFFTPSQFQKISDIDPLAGQTPARGVVEVKSTAEDVYKVAAGEQVARYIEKYGQVLVTNYRDFLLVCKDEYGKPKNLESYRLANNETAFWAAAAQPRKLAEIHGERLNEFLMRVMLRKALISEPKQVAWFLASYARDAKARVEAAAELPALAAVRSALEEALGLKFEGEKGDHFFRSTLVQTLFYGIFSAWVLWSKQHPPTDRTVNFDWRAAEWSLHVPMIRALYHQVASPDKLGPLNLVEVLDWTGEALNRVDRAEFFSKFEEGHAVQYFYEPFLQAFDPELRKDLGVWYTPPEIVKYMVARVDTVLREELGIADGLADPSVYVLDPCCGTGAYLVEVLNRIAETLKAKGEGALLGEIVKESARKRIFGFEILPAPFVVAHLQLGLLLQNLGAPLSNEKNERAGVYLTNALTGWEPPKEPKQHLLFQELEEERDAAEEVKREKPILVILGNPPYNAFAGISPTEEKGLVEPYKEGLISEWGIKKFNLDDLYVRFFRLAERRIAENTGKGIVCYISNYSWTSDPSFVVMRKHLLHSFNRFWIENMHGDRKISEYAPDGQTSETIFAIQGFSAGIKQGTAISLLVKTNGSENVPEVRFRDDLNAAKAIERRAQLITSLNEDDFDTHYQVVIPVPENRFSFRPSNITTNYLEWPKVNELCANTPSNGLMEKRGGALIDIDKKSLEKRMMAFLDPNTDWLTYTSFLSGRALMQAMQHLEVARPKLQAVESFLPERTLRYLIRPFDTQWCYYTPVNPVWNRARPTLWSQYWEGNCFLLTRFNAAAIPEGSPFLFTCHLCDDHVLTPDAIAVPFWHKSYARVTTAPSGQNSLFDSDEEIETNCVSANLSAATRAYLESIGLEDADNNTQTACLIWTHTLAIGYSPAYLAENNDGIRQDWPRIPLPDTKEALVYSAGHGAQVAALLDTEKDVSGVTSGTIRPELCVVAVVSTQESAALDLSVNAGWGHPGQAGVTMPGKGKYVARAYTQVELDAIRTGAESLGLSYEQALKHLGDTTLDIFLNDTTYWCNIPIKVWNYHIGGYQVIKKWLSYRENGLLGRAIIADEAREVATMARRIAAILLLELELDANYERVKASTYQWPKPSEIPSN